MEIKTLAGLQQPDETSLLFSPWGLAKMTAEQASEYRQRLVAQYELPAQVPETTRLAFDLVRTIYSYGVLCYELYTVAGDQARLTLEQALRDRFTDFHGGTVNFADGRGGPSPSPPAITKPSSARSGVTTGGCAAGSSCSPTEERSRSAAC